MTTKGISRYGPIAQTFHWITAVLVLVAFIYGPGGRETRVYSSAMDPDRQLHETLGLAVLLLVTLRLFWRMVSRRPGPPQVPRWMDFTSKIVQSLLYLLMFALPVTAIMGAWLEAHPLTLLGNVHIGPYIDPSHDIGSRIAAVHGWLGDVIMWLAGIHALAAIFHHVVLRDGVLVAMTPRWLPLRRDTR